MFVALLGEGLGITLAILGWIKGNATLGFFGGLLVGGFFLFTFVGIREYFKHHKELLEYFGLIRNYMDEEPPDDQEYYKMHRR